MRKFFIFSFTAFFLSLLTSTAFSKDDVISQAKSLFKNGSYREAADLLSSHVQGSSDSALLTLYGQCLDGMTEEINTVAEKRCYMKGGGATACMQGYAAEMNAKYGEGSFEYSPAVVLIKYTGVHFGQASSGADSDAVAEAEFLKLGKNLIGRPDVVLPRIQEFLVRYPKGEWGNRGFLLWARINEDIWWVHRNWYWLLYNGQIAQDELVVRSEAYRQEALAAFKKVKGGPEGKMAKKELQLLLDYKSDGKMYGIINESDIRGVRVEAVPQ